MERVNATGESYLHTYVRETYDTVGEYARHARKVGARHRKDTHSEPMKFNEWTGFDKALDMSENGWDGEAQASLNVAEQAISRLREERIIPVPTMTWDVSGADVDIARYLIGEPENMMEFPIVEGLHQGDTVTIVKNIGVNCSVSPDEMKRYGRLVASLVFTLEQLGVAVEVWVDLANGCDYGSRLYQRIKVKGTGDYLNPGQLMMALAHPAFFRSVSFASWDDKELPSGIYKGASPGNARGHMENRNRAERDLYPENTLYFDTLRGGQDAVVFLVEQLRKLKLIPEA